MTEAAESNVIDIKPTVAPELEEKVKALHALAMTHHYLGTASFKVPAFGHIIECLNFLSALHSKLLTDALAHPDADKVEKLVEMKKEREEKGKADVKA